MHSHDNKLANRKNCRNQTLSSYQMCMEAKRKRSPMDVLSIRLLVKSRAKNRGQDLGPFSQELGKQAKEIGSPCHGRDRESRWNHFQNEAQVQGPFSCQTSIFVVAIIFLDAFKSYHNFTFFVTNLLWDKKMPKIPLNNCSWNSNYNTAVQTRPIFHSHTQPTKCKDILY